jgi:hypothetical protein
MSYRELFNRIQQALSSPEAYSSFLKEMKSKAVEQAMFNKLSGKKSFRCVVLPEDMGSTSATTENAKILRVRPLDLHDFMIPEPCKFKGDTAKIKRCISMHPVAYPDSSYSVLGGNTESVQAIGFGHIVECSFKEGPQSGGRMRGLTYEPKIVGTNTTDLDLTCISGENVDSTATGAFNNGGQSPNNSRSKGRLRWKDVTIQGSVFPDEPVRDNMKAAPNKHIVTEYIPAATKVFKGEPKGLLLLATAMTMMEGFSPRTTSYKTNNPGNIGNTDRGARRKFATLEEGIEMQKYYIKSVASGTDKRLSKAYPLGKKKVIKPYYSPEIAKNEKNYGISPYLPGYEFIYTGQLDQYVKIYATGARGGNTYVSMVVSYFKKNGINITGQSKIQDIIKLN